jgi:hypothetical protein
MTQNLPKQQLGKLLAQLEKSLQARDPRKHCPSDFDPKPPHEKYAGEREPDARYKDRTKTFQVQHMWEIHHEITRRLLLGQRAADIAHDLSISPSMVSYVRNSPVVKDRLEIMKGARDADTIDLAKRIRENAPIALRLLEDIIEGEVLTASGERLEVPVGMRAKEANNMLARAGYGPITNVKGQHLHGHFTREDIEEIKNRARKDGVDSGAVIDIGGDNEENVTSDSIDDDAGGPLPSAVAN